MRPFGIDRRADGYWIVNTPAGIEECGPYRPRRAAVEARVGIVQFARKVGLAKRARRNSRQPRRRRK